MPKAKITKSFVEQAPYSNKGQILFCDTDLSGFYLIVGKKSKTYVAQKDIRGRTVRHTIGKHGHFTPEQARKIAKDKLYLMAQNINPNKEQLENEGNNTTLKAILENYLSTRKNLKDSTKREYDYHINKYVADWLKKPMTEISKQMILDRHALIGKNNGKQVANCVMRIMRALFNHTNMTYDICEVNPVSYLSRAKAWYPNKRRRTYIKPHQLQTWWSGVHNLNNDTLRDYLIFLLFTGLRKTEAASLKWTDVDFSDRTFTIKKTKNGDPLTLPMGDYVFAMFKKRFEQYSNKLHVFHGSGKSGHLVEPKTSIYKIIKETGISFTCHDLRRTFITMAESLEISGYALKRLINHRSNDVTSGYIIIDVERLRSPVSKIEKFILEKVL